MNRILLACIVLALPSFASAAPCDVLPYASQCQGSNLWPVPGGWAADNNGDCQPEPPQYVSAPMYAYLSWPGSPPTVVEAGPWPGPVSWNDAWPSAAPIHAYLCGMLGGFMESANRCQRDVGVQIGDYNRRLDCPVGYIEHSQNINTGGVCRRAAQVAKPHDGVCTARWTSSAMATLQKDPLDPDCDANSCVFDGTCRLR